MHSLKFKKKIKLYAIWFVLYKIQKKTL